jgi:hypothetical protein
MKQAEVKIGGEYRVKIGSRLALVTVLARLPGRGRQRFLCRTGDTGREVKATAARLRPLVDPPRRPAAAPQAAPEPPAWDGPIGNEWLPAVPVPGLLGRGNRKVVRLSSANISGIHRIVDRIHVAEDMRHLARVIRAEVGRCVQWRTIPADMRRGILFSAACRHHHNRETYREVMRHDPLPSPRAVAEAVAVACGLGREPL